MLYKLLCKLRLCAIVFSVLLWSSPAMADQVEIYKQFLSTGDYERAVSSCKYAAEQGIDGISISLNDIVDAPA